MAVFTKILLMQLKYYVKENVVVFKVLALLFKGFMLEEEVSITKIIKLHF